MRISILALPGSMSSAIAGLADMFWMVNQALMTRPEGKAPPAPAGLCFETAIISADGKPVRDAQGRLIYVDSSFDASEKSDMVLATGMMLGPDKLPASATSVGESACWLKQQYQRGALIGGACAGSFILGEAGLLDGRFCSTTWWLYHTFKQRYPKAKPVWGKALEEQDGIITTGGPLSWVELALHIIRQQAGPDIAKLAADIAVADSQPLSQRIYAPQGFMNTVNPLLLRAEHLIRYENPSITAEELARALNFSDRTLHRKIKELTNESPKNFITRVRIETACLLLENPIANIKRVAQDCGYSEDTAFRRAFSQLMGMTPVQYRKWAMRRNDKAATSAPSEIKNPG
ncbi:GlxA family transcriptional regulator [Dickeya dadantii]|uniref:Transcriptional regulator, AraC family n=1 Tax=Dickeya dadantii (strain 3937) TaxID=198628 RepID=E0SCS0_DICD3|nr:helix-turn-helix domain-containing protein [Dickeya dadantii]ADM99711.1 Transcriptional regulator, AraC family [Dickeya dadantii 3937]NAT77412.1 AraC family transcriptional regulator [Dickeya dadantii]NPE62857.1 helix-turn-helix domain-containing protein [Dickeya dadantii]UAY95444.1 helix-turn-helix domain-containing protein [Dickeya dadantii]